jgi:hypothetical protein
MTNLARVKSELGNLKYAEELILLDLPIVKCNLGSGHIVYHWACYHLGQKRWEEAERYLVDVTERQRNLFQVKEQYQPDRLSGLVELAAVYNALGKFKERSSIVNEARVR